MILPNPGGKVGHRRTQIKSFAPQFRLGGKGISRRIVQSNNVGVAGCPAFLQFEQGAFAIEPAAVSGEAAVRPDHPMARHDDADRIVAVGQSDRAKRAGRSDLRGDLSVGPRLPVRNRQQRRPDPALKRRADQVEFEVEVDQLAGEVRLELFDGVGECRRRRAPSRRGSARRSGRPSADASAARRCPARVSSPTGLSTVRNCSGLHHFSFGGQSLTAWSSAVHRC